MIAGEHCTSSNFNSKFNWDVGRANEGAGDNIEGWFE